MNCLKLRPDPEIGQFLALFFNLEEKSNVATRSKKRRNILY